MQSKGFSFKKSQRHRRENCSIAKNWQGKTKSHEKEEEGKKKGTTGGAERRNW